MNGDETPRLRIPRESSGDDPPNPYDLLCLRLMLNTAQAMRDFLASDPRWKLAFVPADKLAFSLSVIVMQLEATSKQ